MMRTFKKLLLTPLSATDIGEKKKEKIERVIYSPDNKGYRYNQDGWIYLHIEGDAKERGYQHGWLLAQDIADNLIQTQKSTFINTGVEWSYFKGKAMEMWVDKGKIAKEYMDEMNGILNGLMDASANIIADIADIVALNASAELTEYWWPTEVENYYKSLEPKCKAMPDMSAKNKGASDKCSAFMATGSYTADGGVVVAHNSFTPFEEGAYMNVFTDIVPTKGCHFVMQSQPGIIHSFSDFYSREDMLITETTIGGINKYIDGIPEFVRIRKAVQYAASLDEFTEIMIEGNTGGYANTWLVADLNTNEIMRFELGVKFYKIDKTTDGYFAGFNAPLDPRIRNLETSNSGFADIRRHQGARQVRIPQLMEEYKGRIDEVAAMKIISDHYDVYLNKDNNPCSRTVCSHYELDAREYMCEAGRPLPYQPRGAVDGVIGSSKTAKTFSVWGRWGSSCGMPFSAQDFLNKHPQFNYLKELLHDRPTQPWSCLSGL